MTEGARPDNPFPVSENFKAVTPALLRGAIETLAVLSRPLGIEATNARLVGMAATEWVLRMTGAGAEDSSYGLMWEMSRAIEDLIGEGVPFPPFDIVSHCGNDSCPADHSAHIRTINIVFDMARLGQHGQSVKACIAHVRQEPVDEWADARAYQAAMLLGQVAVRVGQYRSDDVEELPRLG